MITRTLQVSNEMSCHCEERWQEKILASLSDINVIKSAIIKCGWSVGLILCIRSISKNYILGPLTNLNKLSVGFHTIFGAWWSSPHLRDLNYSKEYLLSLIQSNPMHPANIQQTIHLTNIHLLRQWMKD